MRTSILSAVLMLTACATQETAKKPDAPAPAVTAPPPAPKFTVDTTRPMPAGLEESAMDLKADPCTSFYEFACGQWMEKTEIPADRPLNSRGFVAISDRNELLLKGILDDAAANKLPAGTAFAKQLSDYYVSCTDEAKLESSLPEVKKYVAKVTALKNVKDLAKNLGALHADGLHAFFGVGSMQDMKNSTEVIGGLDQGGLGLPDRDYYTDEDARKKGIREAYVAYVEKMFTLYGEKADAAKKAAADVMALETRLAKASQTKVERRDPVKVYNRINRDGLDKEAKDFPWAEYFTALGEKDLNALSVNSVPYFKEVAAIAKDTKPELLKTYLTWVVIRSAVPALPKVFQDEAFAFSAKNFTGAKEDRPRWKKCIAFTDGALGEALGREFARRHFPEDAKKKTSDMVAALQKSFEKNLTTLDWMDEPTRQAAMVKVGRMVGNNKIGYPDKWRDYSTVKTTRDSFFANSRETRRFEQARDLAKVGKPVDRTEWGMSPPTVNAYYDAQLNEIVFPAGILQPPFFNPGATDAVNFGGMGMVVGHEITHGFDDEGRQFDADGNLKDWWSDSAGKNFVARADCVKTQYSNYVAVDDIKVKGDLTLGENVADQGGLKLAHQAMLDWYKARGEALEGGARFTASQQFFLGFAQAWCTKMRPEMARMRAATDPHSPAFLRVNGPLGNSDAFKTAFMCADGSKMVRSGAERCKVW